tara:strand:- start:54 stop:1187 length:1134 start_codon:yes stop_codon:yes gene_type:complete
MSILSVDLISPIGSGTTITLNATEVKTGNEITVGTGASIFSPAGNTLILGTNNVERIRIKNDGKVGIGSDNPQDILDVASAVPQIRLSDTSDGSYGQVRANGGNLIIRADEGNTIADSVILAEIDGDEKVRITSNGRIGIGDINPTRDVVLKTSGSVQFSMVGATNQSVYLNFGDTDDDNIGAVYYDNPNDRMIIRANTNNAVQVKSNGNMAINDGDLEIGTSGHGISFAATSDASGSSSELLDDYEEGSWTPEITSQSGSITSYTTQIGSYTKIGRTVIAEYDIRLSDKGNISGGYLLVSLPMNHAGSRAGSGTVYYFQNLNHSVSSLQIELGGATPTRGWLLGVTGTQNSQNSYLGAAYLTNTTQITGQLVYRVS